MLVLVFSERIEARAITQSYDYLKVGKLQIDNRNSKHDIYLRVVSTGYTYKDPVFRWNTQYPPAPNFKIKVWNAVTGENIKTYTLSNWWAKSKSARIKIPRRIFVRFAIDGRNGGYAALNWTKQGSYYIDY